MSFGSFSTMLMSNYVAFAHILGGLLLILFLVVGNGPLQLLKFRDEEKGNTI